MAAQPDHTTTPEAVNATDKVLAAIAATGPHGGTAAHSAHISALGLNEKAVQDALEELVAR